MTVWVTAWARYELISIHIPRVGDDIAQEWRFRGVVISIHIPRVGDDRNEQLHFTQL